MNFRRLCGSPSAFLAEEWNYCAAQLLHDIGVSVKKWSETMSSTAPSKARRLVSSRVCLQARAWIFKLRFGRISLKMDLCSFAALCPKALALASRKGFDGRQGEASSSDSAVACPLESAPL